MSDPQTELDDFMKEHGDKGFSELTPEEKKTLADLLKVKLPKLEKHLEEQTDLIKKKRELAEQINSHAPLIQNIAQDFRTVAQQIQGIPIIIRESIKAMKIAAQETANMIVKVFEHLFHIQERPREIVRYKKKDLDKLKEMLEKDGLKDFEKWLKSAHVLDYIQYGYDVCKDCKHIYQGKKCPYCSDVISKIMPAIREITQITKTQKIQKNLDFETKEKVIDMLIDLCIIYENLADQVNKNFDIVFDHLNMSSKEELAKMEALIDYTYDIEVPRKILGFTITQKTTVTNDFEKKYWYGRKVVGKKLIWVYIGDDKTKALEKISVWLENPENQAKLKTENQAE